MSKIEAGKTVLNEIDFDLRSLLDDLTEMLVFQAKAKGLSFNIELTSGVPRCIRADETKLRQILINLIGNAIKFTARGGVRILVNAERLITETEAPPLTNAKDTSIAAHRLLFTIKDTGFGIAPQEMDVFF